MTVSVPLELEFSSDGDGVTTSFSYPVRFLDKAEIVVILRDADDVDTIQTLNTDYTIAGSSWPSGGSVVFSVAPASGFKVVRYRQTQAKQIVDLANKAKNNAESVEQQLDRLTMVSQDLGATASALSSRAVLYSRGYTGKKAIAEPEAGKILGWNADGTAIVNKEPVSAGAAGAAGAVVFAADLPSDVRNYLDVAPYVETRTDLKALSTARDKVAFLKEEGRDGWFQWTNGDFSALVTADPQEGIYVKANDTATNVGAWVRKSNGFYTALMFGAVGNLIANDRVPLQAGVNLFNQLGGQLRIPAGNYGVDYSSGVACINIDSTITSEPGDNAVTISGDGSPSTQIFGNTSGKFTLNLTGGTGIEAHNYEVHRDFSIMKGTPGSNGLYMFNKAYTALENITIQGHHIALKLESVLSSTFKNLRLANNDVGVETSKGAGFSNCNAINWDNCRFQANISIGYSGGAASTALLFTNCNFEANGRQGQAGDAGASILFDGAEGTVGATFVGGYFESNAGDADLIMANSGTNYVTVVLEGVTFNRNSPTLYPTNCIKTAGKIRLVLQGCGFESHNGYTPNAARQYITGDSELILLGAETCHFADDIEATFALSRGIRSFCGRVSSAGVAVSLPRGWTCSKLATGSYRVTHNLGSTAYGVSPVNDGGTAVFVLSATIGLNSFDVALVNTGFAGTDASFAFTLTRQ